MHKDAEDVQYRGTLIRGIGSFYTVRDPKGREYILRCKKKFRRDGISPLVGDEVLFSPGKGEEHGWVEEILPRKTVCLRPPVANVTRLVIVTAPIPEPDMLLTDRQISRAFNQQMEVILVANKCDLDQDLAVFLRKEYTGAGIPVFSVSARKREGLEELRKFHIDEKEFVELRNMVNFAANIAGGVLAGGAGGAIVAFGAYSAAQALAVASTGTAIASLSGAAATNATLAFFGGGSLAAGGLGMAGGAAVLGGLVAGPALMVIGFVVDAAASKKLEQALTNQAEAIRITEELNTGSMQCEAIRRRTYMFYNLLARLDARFLPLIYKMEDILKTEGDDYRAYSDESKKIIASCASIAVTIKTILDTPLLTDDGLLTGESETTVSFVQNKLDNL